MLVLLDVSKTGLRAPSPACAAALKAQYGERLTVLVDACQFRLSPDALRTYLGLGFLVAVSGSKFLAGPAFSGALLVPRAAAEPICETPLPWRALTCSARQDWPQAFTGRAFLPRGANLGMAVRWWAALAELERLQAAPSADLPARVDRFAQGLGERLARSTFLAPVAAAPPGEASTIFPFVARRGAGPLTAEKTAIAYRRLQGLARGRGAGHLWIGQPVTIGRHGDQSLDALRLSLSARHLQLFATDAAACDRYVGLADVCLWELERWISET